jgi:aspartyl-tRNA(Asn)/glutamyl-tRNA(Gln) amidotransferase subunit A
MTDSAMADIRAMSGTEQAAAIREKTLTSEQVVSAVLQRIETVDPLLHSYCTLDEHVTDAARRADSALDSGWPVGPFHGVPVSVKDLIATKDLRTTFGSQLYADYMPSEDDVVVERLRSAGAIIMGKTNVPEFGYNSITDNKVFGPTHNPWNTDFTSGGSSGGAGAAVAAGLGSLALGSDGGGSIRIPSALCGIFGLKPTFGVVPLYPGCRDPELPGVSSWESLECIGPMTRTVADAATLLTVIAGGDRRDRHSLPSPGIDYTRGLDQGIQGARVAWCPDLGYTAVDPEARRLCTEAVELFARRLGAEVEDACPGFTNPADIFSAAVAADSDLRSLRRLRDEHEGEISDALAGILGRSWTAEEFTDAAMGRQRLYNVMREFLDDYELLLTPTMPGPAFELGTSAPSRIGDVPVAAKTDWTAFVFPMNLTGLPAATVPVGFNQAGLPIGLQIVGRRFEDHAVLRAAAAFEDARPWRDHWPAIG